MKAPGRPSIYSPELAAAICARLAAGESLNAICKDAAMPDRTTVQAWVHQDKDGFSRRYAQAREMGLDVLADEILDISDDTTRDTIATEGGEKMNTEWVARSKLRVDSRKWLLSKLAPKKYGDRSALELSGHLATHEMSEDEIRAELAALTAKGIVPIAKAPQPEDDDELV